MNFDQIAVVRSVCIVCKIAGGYQFVEKEIVLFEDNGLKLEVPVTPEQETVWLNRAQMAALSDRDVKTIGKHIANARREELDGQVVVANFATTTQHGAMAGKTQTHRTEYYNLDVIISVGYRVKSKRGIAFRRWANSVLKQYIIQGYAVNNNRINQLGEVIRIMKRTENALDSKQVLSVIEKYSFLDGNKRIAATVFLYFLDKNGVLFIDGKKLIDDHTLVALTIMIAESRPEEMEMMITVILNCLK